MRTSDLVVMTVTYGSRYSQLLAGPLEVARTLLCPLVVVCNGIDQKYRKQIEDYARLKSIDLHLVINETNLGSAGGFYSGFEFCSKLKYEWLIVLDDDNYVNPLDIKTLNEERLNKASFMVREGRKYMSAALVGEDPRRYLAEDDSFMGLNIWQQVNLRIKARAKFDLSDFDFPWCPYGGLILNVDVIRSAIMPNKDYYLYCDDTDYTNKVSRLFGLRMLKNVKIIDSDESWNVAENENVFQRLLKGKDLWRVYYSVRNQTNFDFSRKKSNANFIINVSLFLLVLFFYSSLLTFRCKDIKYFSRYIFIVRAIFKGFRGQLGDAGMLL